jgi:hypothetical protein
MKIQIKFIREIRININTSRKSKNITHSKKLSKNDKNVVFESKKIIINDITKKYNFTPVISKVFKDKIKRIKLEKSNNKNISLEEMNDKYSRLNTEVYNPRPNIMNNTISDFKLNITKNILKKNPKINMAFFNEKDVKPIEKKKVTKNIIKNNNKKNSYGFGDSYEFNFTFNNFNNNYTQNNIHNTEMKNSSKKKNRINLENLANKTIINDLASMRNNILKDIKDIIIKNKNKKESSKINLKQDNNKTGKIGVIRKNKKKNKDIYAIKIQKIFRGYIFRRKNNKYIHRKNSKEKLNSNFGVYIHKKILKKKLGMNLNINDNFFPNYRKEYNFTETNLTQPQLIENKEYDINNNTKQENKIEEIIIDKNKLINVLGPSKKRNELNQPVINSGYNFGLY